MTLTVSEGHAKGGRRLKRSLHPATAILTVAAFVAGCGGGGDDKAASGSKDEVVFGISTVFSGPSARFGQDHLDVAELFRDQVNANGGIDGHRVVLKTADDKLQPSVGVSETRRLINSENVAALFGSPGSSVAVAEVPVVQRANVPMCLDYTWADEVTEMNTEQVFRIGPYNTLIGQSFVPYLQEKGYEKVAILAEDTDYGIGAGEAIKEGAGDSMDVELIQFPSETQDLTPQLSKLAAQDPPPDATIIASTLAPQFSFYNQAAEVGLPGDKIAGWDSVTQPDFWKTVGDNGVGVVYPTFYASSLELTKTGQDFQEAYKAKFDRDPTIYMFLQWDCLNAIREAIEMTGSIEPGDLVPALPKLDFEGTTGNITLTREKGTVHWNQWEDITVFFKQFTKKGQTDAKTKTVYTTKPAG